MFDFTKTNAMKGIGKHSTLISFIITAVGDGANAALSACDYVDKFE